MEAAERSAIVGEHWFSDMVAGWTLGYLVALAMLRLFTDKSAVY